MPGVLHTAEGRIGSAHHGRVDADHPALNRISEQQRAPTVLREAIRRKTVWEPIGLFNGFVKSLERAHQCDRSERLFVHHTRFERYVGKHGGSEEEAILAGASAR